MAIGVNRLVRIVLGSAEDELEEYSNFEWGYVVDFG